MGPFFWRFARALEKAGAEVSKINFCAGDVLFYPGAATSYRGTADSWPAFLAEHLIERRIDVVFLFGDCRPLHRAAADVARGAGVSLFVFEEGYLRPDYVTVEPGGANDYSAVPRDPEVFEKFEPHPAYRQRPLRVRHAFFWHMVFATFYFLASYLFAWRFPHYQHHKPFRPGHEAFVWTRGAARKVLYRWQQRRHVTHLSTTASGRFYLVPLQVERDAQIAVHSEFRSVPEFIHTVLNSYARYAPPDTLLVFKHHPYDRGHNNYASVIDRVARRLGIAHRVVYVHDLHLPTLLKHARGTVVINSTVGLSSVHHRTPVCVLGRANYALPGLTHQGSLQTFWHNPARPEARLYRQFRGWLIAYNQANGSFYAPLSGGGMVAGLRWPALFKVPAKPHSAPTVVHEDEGIAAAGR
jgi:capsular polysaccharide export protein